MQIKLRTTQKNIIETGEFFNPNIDIKMTSREIAKLTHKHHRNICRDIKNMLNKLNIDVLNFEQTYIDGSNRKQREYLLPKKYILCLVASYDAKLMMTIINRLEELEESNYRNFNNTILHRTLELEKQIAYNGSEWGRMGVDQREARKGFKEFEEAVKKLIQPDLPLED